MRHRAVVRACLLLLASALFGACLARPPHLVEPFLNTSPGQEDTLESSAWLVDPQRGDRYAVAGADLLWRDEARIGPADDQTGRCAVRPDGTVTFKTPRTPGEWPCLLRACRETCKVGRVTFVVKHHP